MFDLAVIVAAGALAYFHGYLAGQLSAGRKHLADLRAQSERMDEMNLELARAFSRTTEPGDGE